MVSSIKIYDVLYVVKRTLDPLVYGDYPPEMKYYHGTELPEFSSEEIELLRDSIDFIGINHYGTVYAKDCIDSGCFCNESSCVQGSDRAIRGFVFSSGERNGVPIGERVRSFDTTFQTNIFHL